MSPQSASVKHNIPQSIFCHNEEVPKEDCHWSESQQSYICDLSLLEPSEEIAEVIVIDHKGCTDTLALFDCMPQIDKIKPNPFWNTCIVELTGIPMNMPISYNIYSVDGRLVLRSEDQLLNTPQNTENMRSIEIELDERFKSGMYFIEFLIGNIDESGEPAFKLTEKLIKMEYR